MRTLPTLLAVLGLALLAAAAPAAPMLTVVPPAGVDLSNLQPGQTVAFQVVLSGLNSGDSLDFLAAKVAFDDSIFGLPTIAPALTPAGIVPEAGGFTGSTFLSPGAVDGSYDDLFAPLMTPITANGVFYTFTLTVQGSGAGTVGLDFGASTGFNGSGDPLPPLTTGPPLDVVAPAAPGVPEPATALLLLTALAAACARARRR